MARRKKNENEEINTVQEQKEISENIKIPVIKSKEEEVDKFTLKTVIAKEPIPFRKIPSKGKSCYAGMMPANTAFTIVKEISNISGDWFRLSNNRYIPATGNYIIK